MLLITDLCVQSDLSMTDKFVIADVTAGFYPFFFVFFVISSQKTKTMSMCMVT